MNKFIKQQLQKSNTPLPFWDDNTTQIIINKKGSGLIPSNDINVGDKLRIKIDDYIIHPSSNFTLSSNWNNGTNPPEHLMNVSVIQIMGKMIKVDGIGETSELQWVGWLPRKGFNIL